MLQRCVPIQESFSRNGSFKLSPVQDSDLPALQELLDSSTSKDPYSRSAAYYALTGRKGLWLAQNNSTTIILCRHPNTENEILLFPPVGEVNQDFTSMVTKAVKMTGVNVRMARFTDTDLKHLNNSSVIDEKVLDWAYPVHTLDTKAVANHKGRAFQQVRTDLNKLQNHNLSAQDLNPTFHKQAVLKIANAWSGNDPAIVNLYQRLLDLNDSLPIDGRIIFKGNQPVAFSLWDKTHPNHGFANTFAMLSAPNIEGLSRFLVVDMCQALHDKGFDRVCIGGSEDEGLDQFKRLLRPINSVSLSTLTINTKILFNKLNDNSIVKSMPSIQTGCA